MNKKMPAEALRKVGRPPKIIDKLCRSINLKLSETDYADVLAKAKKAGITATEYARQMVLNGYVKAPFTPEHLSLMRKISGMANNLNQYVKLLNSGEMYHKLNVASIVIQLKQILDDCSKSKG